MIIAGCRVFCQTLINIYLLIGVIKYFPHTHRLVSILTIIGLSQIIPNWMESEFGLFVLINIAIVAGLIGLGFYLHSKLFPDYLTVKERYQDSAGKSRIRDVIKFED